MVGITPKCGRIMAGMIKIKLAQYVMEPGCSKNRVYLRECKPFTGWLLLSSTFPLNKFGSNTERFKVYFT